MLRVNEKNMVSGVEIHRVIESKNKRFDIWVKRVINYADLKIPKDFCTKVYESTGGRPFTDYEFTLDAAKEICLLEKNGKGKEIRRWLIELSNQRDTLNLITIKEAAFAVKVINCLKYVDNQKEAFKCHQSKYIAEHVNSNANYIYAEFAKYRASIVGWDKPKIDEAINMYLNEHSGYNRSIVNKCNTQTKLSIIDIGEAIRVACLDILFAKDTDELLAARFSNMCKNLAKEMNVTPEKHNENTLFRSKDVLNEVKEISI